MHEIDGLRFHFNVYRGITGACCYEHLGTNRDAFLLFCVAWPWSVPVHAAFVVLETIAPCYISRRFFDDVIGLEKIVQARTKEVHMILNNIGQEFLTVDHKGVMSEERSTVVSECFGDSEEGCTFDQYIRSVDETVSGYFELGLESVQDGILPQDVALNQLSNRIVVGISILEMA